MNKKLIVNNKPYIEEAFKRLKESQEDNSSSEYDDDEIEIETCAIRLDTRSLFYEAVLSDLNERIRDNELSVIKETKSSPFVKYIIQGRYDSIYSFLHQNRRMMMDYEYLPQDESYKEDLKEDANSSSILEYESINKGFNRRYLKEDQSDIEDEQRLSRDIASKQFEDSKQLGDTIQSYENDLVLALDKVIKKYHNILPFENLESSLDYVLDELRYSFFDHWVN